MPLCRRDIEPEPDHRPADCEDDLTIEPGPDEDLSGEPTPETPVFVHRPDSIRV